VQVFDGHVNLAVATIATTPGAPTTATVLEVGAGEAARFVDELGVPPFNLTIHPADEQPTPANAEIVRVLSEDDIDTVNDELTVVREAEGLFGPVSVAAGMSISNGDTAKIWRDVERALMSKGLTRLEVYGHSFVVGGGASDADRDAMTHLASMLGAGTLEVNRAFGGAIASWPNIDPYNSTGNGGFQTIYQYHKTRPRVVSKVSSSTSTTITVGTVYGGVFAIGQLIGFGKGANAQYRSITGVAGSVLTVDAAITGTISANDPVIEIPFSYGSLNPLSLLWFGNNDFPNLGMGNQTDPASDAGVAEGKPALTNALRAMIAYKRCAEVYDAAVAASTPHPSITLGAGLANSDVVAGQAGSFEGTYVIGALNSGDTFDIQVPANFQGGTIALGFANAQQTGSVVRAGSLINFTVDGNSAGSLDTRIGAYKFGATVKFNTFCKRLTGLAAGAHVITVTVSTTGVAGTYFDWWGIESLVAPLVILPSPLRVYTYALWPNHQYTEIKGTANANHGTGVSSFTITAGTNPSGGTQIIRKGEPITFDHGGANEETLTVAADVAAGGTTVTTTTASTLAHNTGGAYRAHMHDKAIVLAKQWYADLAAEFDDAVIYVDLDKVIHGNDGTAGTSATKDGSKFTYDAAHPNDIGNELMAKALYREIVLAAALNVDLIASLSVPTAPLPGAVYLAPMSAVAAGTAAPTDPAASNAMAAAYPFTQSVDLRRARYARLEAHVLTACSGAGIAKVECSVDGVTWKTLGRKQTGANTVDNALTDPGNLDISTVGRKTSKAEITLTAFGATLDGWFYLPAEVNVSRLTMLRLVHGNRTTGTTDPAYGYARIDFQ